MEIMISFSVISSLFPLLLPILSSFPIFLYPFLYLYPTLSSPQAARSSPPSSCRRRLTDRPCCCSRRSISCPPWTSSSVLPSRSAPTLTIWETDVFPLKIHRVQSQAPGIYPEKLLVQLRYGTGSRAGGCMRYSSFFRAAALESVRSLLATFSNVVLAQEFCYSSSQTCDVCELQTPHTRFL